MGRNLTSVLVLLFLGCSLLTELATAACKSYNDTCVLDVVFVHDTNFLNMRTYVKRNFGVILRHISDIFPGSRFGFATFANRPWDSSSGSLSKFYKLWSPLTSRPGKLMDDIKSVDSCDSCNGNGPEGALLAVSNMATNPLVGWSNTPLNSKGRQVVKFIILIINDVVDIKYDWSNFRENFGVTPPSPGALGRILRDNGVNIIGVYPETSQGVWLKPLFDLKVIGGYGPVDFSITAGVALSIEYAFMLVLCTSVQPVPGAVGPRCKVATTAEDPDKQASTTKFDDSSTEDFDDRYAKSYALMWSMYGLKYEPLNVTIADGRGGAGGIGNYASVTPGNQTRLSFPVAQQYFGLWMSAIPRDSLIEFYRGEKRLFAVEGEGIYQSLRIERRGDNYAGNPNYRMEYPSRAYAFLNFYFEDKCRYDKVVLSAPLGSGESLDTDNHTTGNVEERSGKSINPHKRIVPWTTAFYVPGIFPSSTP